MRGNNRGYVDSRRLFSGKDAVLYDEDGVLLATVDNFVGQVTWTNADYSPLGDMQQHSHVLSYKVSLAITSCLIESDRFIREMYESMKSGIPVWWSFAHDIFGWEGSHERVIYRDCVPDGQIDLLNAQVNETLKRTLNLVVNQPPELQSILKYASSGRYSD